MKLTKLSSLAAVMAAILITPLPSFAQAPDAANNNNGNNRRGNQADFRQRMNDRLKAALKVTDDEWAVIQPLIEKVQTKQREMGGFGGFGRRGGAPGAGGAGGNAQATPPAPAGGAGGAPRGGSPEAEALRAAIDDPNSSAEDIKAKLTALRETRKKNAVELEAARSDLRKVLTQRQEAALVSMNILE